eukprot:CAMPEP_0179861180 /NCGR_PEP_ID=MMETSP0982-20121206/14098_1 /TAXON_ID=483367 /ORGANISM="non described non described, Strain CCMP 2436" /LENGTH=238 /DNA_ID=CAMNT_0021748653 /DNA_START=32 /DNA_END=744 /DNA_ORIENTATION=+
MGKPRTPGRQAVLTALCLLALGSLHAWAEDAAEGKAGNDHASQFGGEDDKPKKVTAHPDADERRADEVRVGVGGPPADADLIRTPRRAAPRAVPHGPPRVSSSSDDLFFGWSTGHVGSTSLSTSSAYASSATRSMRSFAFRFEFLRRSRFDISRLFIKANGTVAHQTDTVRAKLSSSVDEIFRNMDLACDAEGFERVPKRTYVDFGHHSLFFIEGLLEAYLRSPVGSPRPRLVRIRRG